MDDQRIEIDFGGGDKTIVVVVAELPDGWAWLWVPEAERFIVRRLVRWDDGTTITLCRR